MPDFSDSRRPWWKPRFPIKVLIVAVTLLLLYVAIRFPIASLVAGIGVGHCCAALTAYRLLGMRLATAVALTIAVSITFFAMVPGQEVQKVSELGQPNPFYNHGWPLTYLSRHAFAGRSEVNTCWSLTRKVESLSIPSLAVDAVACIALAIAFTCGIEIWQRRRRTGWRLSLAEVMAILTGIALVCIVIGYEKRAYDTEQLAIKELAALKTDPYCRYHRRGPTFLRELIGNWPLSYLDRVAYSEAVNEHPHFADQFSQILSLRPASLTSEDIAAISRLHHLQSLHLFGVWKVEESRLFPGEGCLCELPPMPGLKIFDSTEDLSPRELDWLSSCTSLTNLELADGESNADLLRLRPLKKLQSASFECSEPFSAETLQSIAQWTELRELHLEGKVGAAALAHLRTLPRLQVLGLHGYNCPIGDLEVSELQKFVQLKELRISKNVLADSSLEQLRKALPAAQVTRPLE